MLYVTAKAHGERVCLLEIAVNVCHRPGTLFSDGNVANSETSIFSDSENLCRLDWEIICSESAAWGRDWKRVRSAEILVPQMVEPDYITAIHIFPNADTSTSVTISDALETVQFGDIEVCEDLAATGLVR